MVFPLYYEEASLVNKVPEADAVLLKLLSGFLWIQCWFVLSEQESSLIVFFVFLYFCYKTFNTAEDYILKLSLKIYILLTDCKSFICSLFKDTIRKLDQTVLREKRFEKD
jgi:hypothetical protein